MYVIDCNGLEIDVILDYILYSVKLVIFFCIILGIYSVYNCLFNRRINFLDIEWIYVDNID